MLKLNCDKALFNLKWRAILNYNDLLNFTGKWYYNYYFKKINMFNYTLSQIDDYEKKGFKI